MIKYTDTDRNYMKKALELAGKAKGTTFPNPSVGAIIVKNNRITGSGATGAGGRPHAEAAAIKKAGSLTYGSTMYVTLEPCSHFGKTAPCSALILKSGIKKIFIAYKDPNPLVSGRGIRFLKKNGIIVSCGLCKKEAEKINEDFNWYIINKKPWLSLKLAMTLDGRIADHLNHSFWITGRESRKFVHRIRQKHAAVAVGKSTIINDNPRLTVRHVKGHSPARIIFASHPNSITLNSNIRKSASSFRTIIIASKGKKGLKSILSDKTEVWYTGSYDYSEKISVFQEMAYRENLSSVLVEGGSSLSSFLLERNLINRLYLFYANHILGNGLNAFSFSKGLLLKDAIHLKEMETKFFGKDIMISGIPIKKRN